MAFVQGIGAGGRTRKARVEPVMVMKPARNSAKSEEKSEKEVKGGTAANVTWWQKMDKFLWDFTYGWKEKKWSPKSLSGEKFDRKKTTLSWGNEQQVISPYELSEEFLTSLGTTDAAEPTIPPAHSKVVGTYVNESSLKGGADTDSLNAAIFRLADWADVPKDESQRVLDGRTLAELCFSKYGKYHDMDIIQAQPFGSQNRQVAFNIYYASLGASNFPYNETEYLDKLSKVTDLLNSVDQAWFVRQFLAEPIKPRRGLPSTPRWDTAVTLRLNTSPTWRYISPEIVDQYFSW
mmetsp:Transcript_4631/g.14002  ORF Transcript_4631/g.14002 Transcript_4631/m.14002 type:complete len:292 (+) Transcript_4631:103-978(+)